MHKFVHLKLSWSYRENGSGNAGLVDPSGIIRVKLREIFEFNDRDVFAFNLRDVFEINLRDIFEFNLREIFELNLPEVFEEYWYRIYQLLEKY